PLTEIDFSFEPASLLSLNVIEGVCIVLFYTDSPRSDRLMKVWSQIAQTTVGVKIAACNVTNESKVADAFANISVSHPLHGSSTRFPLFVNYEDGYPMSKYRGDYDEREISDWVGAIMINY